MGTTELVNAIQAAGTIGVLVVVVAALVSGRVVTKSHHEEVVRGLRQQLDDTVVDRDFWRDQSLSGTDLLDRATDLATRRALARPSRHAGGSHASRE